MHHSIYQSTWEMFWNHHEIGTTQNQRNISSSLVIYVNALLLFLLSNEYFKMPQTFLFHFLCNTFFMKSLFWFDYCPEQFTYMNNMLSFIFLHSLLPSYGNKVDSILSRHVVLKVNEYQYMTIWQNEAQKMTIESGPDIVLRSAP